MSKANTIVSLQDDTPELASAYEEASIVQFKHGRVLIDQLQIKPAEHVLDIGAGTGRLAEYVAEIVGPRGEVIGIDPLENRIAIAHARASKVLRFNTGRAEDLSEFRDGQFDVVYLNSVFHWIEDKAGALQEIFRVLKSGGRIGVNTQDPSVPHETRMLIQSAIVDAGFEDRRNNAHFKDRRGDTQAAFGVSREALELLFTSAGFYRYRSELLPFVDFHESVQSLIKLSASSAFGNFLADFSEAEREAILRSLSRLAELKRTAKGIKLERYLRFAIATKPG